MQKQDAIARLHESLKPGDTVQTILRHVSRSGMQRAISPVVNGEDVSYLVHPLGIGNFNRKHGGLTQNGCGMDMGFNLVYNLSCVLFSGGFGCIGEGCPSNDHSNGDRDYTPHFAPGRNGSPSKRERDHWHKDGGYALRQRWL